MGERLQLNELRSILDRVQYKPGWEMSVYDTEFQDLYWSVQARVENSYQPGEYVDLRIKSALPPFYSEREFIYWLRWRLAGIEVHECHEWFRWTNGKAVFDPHREGVDEPVGAASGQ